MEKYQQENAHAIQQQKAKKASTIQLVSSPSDISNCFIDHKK